MFKRIAFLILGLCVLTTADSWSFYGGPWCAKRLTDVAIGLKDGTPVIYGINFDSSLVKSTDQGQTWVELLQDVPVADRKVRCVTCDPNNADLLYVGLPFGYGRLFEGIECSTDGGNTWSEVNTGLPGTFVPSALAMRDAQHVVLGMDPLASADQAIYYWNVNQWTAAWIVGDKRGFRITDLKWDPRNTYPWIIYASSDKSLSDPNYIGIYKSEDYGHNWVQIGHPDPDQPSGYMMRPEALSVCCALNGYIYAGYRPEAGSHTDGGVMRTTDGGTGWERVLFQEALPVHDVQGDPADLAKTYAAFGSSDNYSYDGLGIYRYDGSGWSSFDEGLTDLYTNVITLMKASNQDYLCLGTDNSFFVRNLTTPGNWIERIKGMHKSKIITVEPRIPNFFSFSNKANFVSQNNGTDWSTRSAIARISENLSAQLNPISNSEMLKWTQRYLPNKEYDLFHTTDGGFTWISVYIENNDIIPPIPNIDYSYSTPSVVYTFSNHSQNYERFVLRSTNSGILWSSYPTELVLAKISSITCDRTAGGMNHIFITGVPNPGLIHESTNGGINWQYRTPVIEFGWGKIQFDPFSNTKLLAELAADGNSTPLWLRTTNCGSNWQTISNIPNHYPGPFIIDFEEPSLVYTAPFNSNTNYNDFFFSVDYCKVWIQDNRGLPGIRIWDLGMDANAPQYLYAGTDSSVWYYDPPFLNKHLVSSSNLATSYNNGKKMIAGMSDIWVAYESGGVVYAVHSSDAGITWSQKMEIGFGYNPAIASKPEVDPPVPGVVWRAQNTRDTLYFARYVSDDDWTVPFKIVSTDNNYGPPSFVIGTDNIGRIAFDENGKSYYTEFDIDNPAPITPEDVGQGINPSIGYMMPGSNNPEIHVVWEDNLKIKYRSRTVGGTWGSEETVYSSNSHRPSIEIAGSTVYVVCERSSNIDYRYTVYTQNGQHTAWSKIKSFSSQYTLGYPVLSGGNMMCCVANVNGKGEIYFWYNPGGPTWIGPTNISNTTDTHSEYPHIVHRQTIAGTVAHFTWTENDNPAYDIQFANYSIGGYDSNEDLAFYVAQGGDTLASPFNLKRTGFLQYGTEPYKRVDYDYQYLEYEFRHLDPSKDYALTAYVYQEGNAHLPLTIKVDNVLIGGISLPSETLITFKKLVPYNFYADSVINIKIFGNKAVGSSFVLHQYERESGGSGGPQSQNAAPVMARQPTMMIYPTTVKDNFTIEFSLVKKSQIAIKLYDITGRIIKELLKSDITTGKHRFAYSASDLPQGVYFIHLDTGEFHLMGKIILMK